MNDPIWPDDITDYEKKLTIEILRELMLLPEDRRIAFLRATEVMLRARGVMDNNGRSIVDEFLERHKEPGERGR